MPFFVGFVLFVVRAVAVVLAGGGALTRRSWPCFVIFVDSSCGRRLLVGRETLDVPSFVSFVLFVVKSC